MVCSDRAKVSTIIKIIISRYFLISGAQSAPYNGYDTCSNPYEDYVYNIEVADNHTYFVGHDAIWVHDANQ